VLRHLLAGWLLALPLTVQAIPADVPLRSLSYQSWGEDDGLPQMSAEALVFDRDGFAWIGTQKGLAKFDGSQFQVFDLENTPALKANFISRLFVDGSGRLWIGTIKGLVSYQDHTFSGVAADGKEVGRVNGLTEDAQGRLYVASDRGAFRMEKGRLTALPALPAPVTSALAGPGAVWLATPGHLVQFVGDQQKDLALPQAFANAVVTGMAWSDGRLWLSTSLGLLQWHAGQFDVVPLEPSGTTQPSIQSVAADGASGLWAGNAKILYRLDRGRLIERIVSKVPGVMPWPRTMRAGPDDFWLGSQTDGVQHFWRSQNRRLGPEDGLPDPIAWSFARDGSRLLIGTNTGVAVVENGKARPYIAPEALPYPVAYSLLRDQASRLWVGTFSGLARFKPDGQADRTLPEFASIQINGLTEDDRGTVWAATSSGLFRIDGDQVQPYGASMGLPATGVRFVLHARDGQFWVGTEDGLFQREGEGFKAIKAEGLEGAFVTSILEPGPGRLVVGTLDRGLFVRGPKGWRHWDRAQGLPWSSTYFLAAVDHWLVGAGSGVYRIPLDALEQPQDQPLPVDVLFSNPGEQQGGARIRCCNGAGNGKGMLIGKTAWLATTEGALQVNVDTPTPQPPVAHIIGVQQAQNSHPAASKSVLLEGPSRDATIQYGAIDYRHTAPLQFRYRLVGFDADWVDAKERYTAFYTNLPPGRFTFEVAARRAHGVWSAPVALTLEVPRRLIETWWFRLLCGLAGLALVVLLMNWRLRQLKLQKLALEAVVAERTRELEKANHDLREMSITDALTGLHNRRFLEQLSPKLVAKLDRRRAETGRDLVIGVMVVDIDHFKQINDRFGHAAGDLVLQRAAAALRVSVRDGEFVLRWGGEEFLAVIDTAERSLLPAIAQRLHQAIAHCCDGLELRPGEPFAGVTCSIGYAAVPITPGTTALVWQDTIQLADFALYAAKNAGRNRCMSIDPDQVPATQWRNNLKAR